MITFKRLSNGRQIKLKLYFVNVNFGRLFEEIQPRDHQKVIQYNRYENKNREFYIKFYKGSIHVYFNFKSKKEGRFHKTYLKA